MLTCASFPILEAHTDSQIDQSIGTLASESGTCVIVSDTTRVSHLWEMFERSPTLLGVLVYRGEDFCTAISRVFLADRLFQRFGREVFSRSSIADFVLTCPPPVLELEASTPILAAASAAASRLGDIHPPALVVRFENRERVLLDGRLLLITSCELSGRIAADLDRQREAATKADLAKSHFLANMSHEIRTPMTAILGFVELLDRPDTTDETRTEHVATIRRNGKHLLAIINDILDLSKIEAGKMTVERIPTNPIQVVEETLSLMGVRAVEKGLRLACDWSWPIPQTITSDPVRLRQILINLIGNAIKFTQHGRVALDIRWDSESRCFITQISDTGEGMTAEQLSGLFKPFTQADPSTTRRFGGTGMGLAISRHFAEALGGSISVGSTPGVGTTFTLRIPTEEASAFYQSHPGALVLSKEPPKHIDNQPLRGQRILLAEDGIDNQRLISFHLRKAGAQVSLAENGLLARDMAINESRRGQPFDMILMDMQMPVMDGYTATTHLRALGYTGRIVALTAHAMNEDRKRCLDAGCDGFQTKPIDRAQLIQACLAPTDTGATSAAA